MFLINLIKKLVYPETYNGEIYVRSLRERHNIDIGEHCRIWEPNHTYIDIQRPHMLHIGDYVKIARGVTILAHDFSRSVFTGCNYPNVGECKFTHIGDNVFIGMNAIILMGAHIGNNSIVGAGAVVSGTYDDGVVIAGNPGKVICTVDEYYNKLVHREITAAKAYVAQWRKKFNRNPSVIEMTDAFAWIYLPREEKSIRDYGKMFKLGGVDEQKYIQLFMNTEPIYSSFEAFLKDCEGCEVDEKK